MTRVRLSWRHAVAQDRQLHLQSFTCTVPARRGRLGRPLPHPRPWEREVEAGIRTLKPPIGDGALQLGSDAQGLAAVSLVYFTPRGRTAKIAAIAVATRVRGRGGKYADEALELALRAAADYGFSKYNSVVTVVGQVDPRNAASQRMSARAGLVHLDDVADGRYQEWGRDLELPPDETTVGLAV